MSLLRRKRRQNRLRQELSPATRTTRFVLVPQVRERGLRNILTGRRLVRFGEHKRPDLIVGDFKKPTDYEIRRFERNKIIDEYRRRYQQVMSNQLKPRIVRKPIYNLQMDGTVKVDLPPEHPICIKREERRMILFATGKAGKGGQQPRQNNNDIKIRCEK